MLVFWLIRTFYAIGFELLNTAQHVDQMKKKSYLSLRYKGSRLDLKVLTEHTCSLPNKPSKYRKPNNQSNKKKKLVYTNRLQTRQKTFRLKGKWKPSIPNSPPCVSIIIYFSWRESLIDLRRLLKTRKVELENWFFIWIFILFLKFSYSCCLLSRKLRLNASE